jgi:hypothetical protein
MAIYTLDFLNKNKYRRYPFRAETSLQAEDGRTLSNSLIVAASFSLTGARSNLRIGQIYVKGQFIDILLCCTYENRTVSLGRFSGTVVEDYSVLYLEQFERFVSGTLTLGGADLIADMSGGYFFNSEATRLEDSTVFYYTPPGVKSLVREAHELRGRVEFGNLTNLTKSRAGKTIKLSTSTGVQIASLADRASQFKNCKTPLIYNLNETVPFKDTAKNYPILDGNVYMVGIKPITFYGEFGTPEASQGTIQAQTIDINNKPLTLATLCTARNKVLPPVDPVYLASRPDEAASVKTFEGKKNYYTKSYNTPVNFVKATEPEFLSWPQFFKNFTGFAINKQAGTRQDIALVPADTVGTKIVRVVLRNSPNSGGVGASLRITIKKNDILFVNNIEYLSLTASQAVVIDGVNEPFASGDRFSVYLDTVTGSGYTLQVILFYR